MLELCVLEPSAPSVDGSTKFGWLSGTLLQAQFFTVPTPSFWNYSAAAEYWARLGLATLGVVCDLCYQLAFVW